MPFLKNFYLDNETISPVNKEWKYGYPYIDITHGYIEQYQERWKSAVAYVMYKVAHIL